MWLPSLSSSCSEYEALGDVFEAFQSAYENNGDQRELDPVAGEGWTRTAFKGSDGWTMEKYAGSGWSMTAYSKWFVEDGKGYTVQVRSKSTERMFSAASHRAYDIVLYDASGKRLASIEEDECLAKIKGRYSERQHLPLLEGALQAIKGGDVEIRVSRPTGRMWFWEEVGLDELSQP